MNFNKLAKESHANAVKHGFWEKRESNEHCLMLVVSEIGEMVEAHRAGKRANLEAYNEPLLGGCAPFTSFIKDTLEDEMADVAIRLGDLAGALGVDFDKMNPCKYHRAFDKFTFTENAFALPKVCAVTSSALKSASNSVWSTSRNGRSPSTLIWIGTLAKR